ncbi:MAG: hypothetical protein N3A38_11240, partial [Planctomycetota bacterium]|nr:hypothetical protein [Planctomycetota bacterium]
DSLYTGEPLAAARGDGRRRAAIPAAVAALAVLVLTGCGRPSHGRIWDFYSARGGTNSGIIWTEYGTIVVDAQETPSAGYMACQQASLASQRLWEARNRARGDLIKRGEPPPVLYLMNTSHLPQSWFGNQSFTKAEIISSGETRRLMRREFEVLRKEAASRHPRRDLEDLKMTLPTLTVESGAMTLHTPQSDVVFIVLPKAPLPGQAVVFLESEKVLFAGSLVPGSGIPDVRGRDIPAWIEALEFVEKLEPAYVLPASGQPMEGRSLARLRNYLSELWSVARAEAAGRKDGAAGAAKIPSGTPCGGQDSPGDPSDPAGALRAGSEADGTALPTAKAPADTEGGETGAGRGNKTAAGRAGIGESEIAGADACGGGVLPAWGSPAVGTIFSAKFDLPEFRRCENYDKFHLENVAEALRQLTAIRARRNAGGSRYR